VPSWFEHWEQHLSRFRPNSELRRLNRSSGQGMPVSHTLWEVVHASLRSARASDGLVSPTILQALEVAGYDRSFEAHVTRADGQEAVQQNGGGGPEIGPRARNAARSATAVVADDATGSASTHGAPIAPSAWKSVLCDPRNRTLRLPPGVRLDLGGVAKGWAADQAARELGAHGPALVDAGGDIAVTAPPTGEPGWRVGVADPCAPDGQVALLCVAHAGVATSGRDYRRWRHNGHWQHHLIDPRTGRPADTDVLTATVVAPSTERAEMAAKAALLLGSRDGLAWLDARSDLAGLLVRQDGQVLLSRRMPGYVWR
jgi:thiamine biosynthesis lipoprotein